MTISEVYIALKFGRLDEVKTYLDQKLDDDELRPSVYHKLVDHFLTFSMANSVADHKEDIFKLLLEYGADPLIYNNWNAKYSKQPLEVLAIDREIKRKLNDNRRQDTKGDSC
jgi:hypothetical protein